MSPELRLEAAAALPSRSLEPELFSLLIGHLSGDFPINHRVAAVDALTRAKLSLEQLATLAGTVAHVGPLELNRLLAIFETVSDASVGEKLIAGLQKSPVLTSLRVDALKQRIAKFPAPVQQQAEVLYAAINVEAAKQKERLDELVALVGQGDVRRGQVVFGNSKAACTACHAMGYKGGNVGPDLSRIGKIRSERDLLESILFPSVSLVRSYEPILIVTHSGKTHNGLIRRENADEVVLATGAHQEVRIPRSDIEEIRPSTVSVMPAGLDTQLTREQIIDLVTFLKSRQ
jgi:putative heme-binding domain-containing protein